MAQNPMSRNSETGASVHFGASKENTPGRAPSASRQIRTITSWELETVPTSPPRSPRTQSLRCAGSFKNDGEYPFPSFGPDSSTDNLLGSGDSISEDEETSSGLSASPVREIFPSQGPEPKQKRSKWKGKGKEKAKESSFVVKSVLPTRIHRPSRTPITINPGFRAASPPKRWNGGRPSNRGHDSGYGSSPAASTSHDISNEVGAFGHQLTRVDARPRLRRGASRTVSEEMIVSSSESLNRVFSWAAEMDGGEEKIDVKVECDVCDAKEANRVMDAMTPFGRKIDTLKKKVKGLGKEREKRKEKESAGARPGLGWGGRGICADCDREEELGRGVLEIKRKVGPRWDLGDQFDELED